MPRHARNIRRRRAWSIGRWLFFFAVTSLIAAWEAARIADARATVASGWAAGLAAGTGGGLVLAALVAVTPLVQRQRQWSRYGRPQAVFSLIVILTTVLLLVVAILTSTPPRQHGSHPVPYVITSGIGVAEVAYVGIVAVAFAVVMVAWLVVQVKEHNSSLD
jgi:hypothetical protein